LIKKKTDNSSIEGFQKKPADLLKSVTRIQLLGFVPQPNLQGMLIKTKD